MKDKISSILEESIQVKKTCAKTLPKKIADVVDIFCQTLSNGNKIIFFGNGGSAADAQHLAGELVNRFLYDRRALAAVALNTDTSVLTCIANDSDYNSIFSRQLEALGRPGDLAVGISTSGNSPNVVKALVRARELGLKTVGFTGATGGEMAALADYLILAPTSVTPRIQEAHITIGHIICQLVEEIMCPKH